MSFLEEVAARSHKRVQADKQRVTVEQLRQWIKKKPAPKDFRAAIHKAGQVSLIAELKQASPSAGVIRIENDIPARITGYALGGAGAVSSLTEEEYFHGSPQLLEAAREQTALPLLRKDFIVDSYQIEESRVLGADAILLIAALLPGGLLYDFVQRTLEAQMAPLVEVHDERDLERAINAHAKIIGVNNLDLRTLKVDMAAGDRAHPANSAKLAIPSFPKAAFERLMMCGGAASWAPMLCSWARASCGRLMRRPLCARLWMRERKRLQPMAKVKICGITNAQDALWAVNLGVDFIGLNFYGQSPRKVSVKHAKELLAQIPPFIKSVGLFVDEPFDSLQKTVKATGLKWIQLHGSETPDYAQQVKGLGVTVMKAIAVEKPLEPADVAPYQDSVDYFLFDHRTPELAGGTGVPFNWEWIQNTSFVSKPWFLAGGLTPDNVAAALKQTQAAFVDVCSGVEKSPTRAKIMRP